MKLHGIHHISSIVGHAQRNVDFYAGLLGMRLVKKTLNFDDSSTYHFYYGNENGSTNLLTTFPWNDAESGQIGGGQVGITSLAISPDSLDFWKQRLNDFKIEYHTEERFNVQRLAFEDMDGLLYELVASNEEPKSNWEFNGVDSNHAIKGIDSAYIYSRVPHATLSMLQDVFNYKIIDESFDAYLLAVDGGLGSRLELNKTTKDPSRQGVGTVHHIALGISNGDEEAWLEKLIAAGYRPTEIKERKYFRSIYFREKGGILIELATVGPGVLVDESEEELGKELLIPPHFEAIKDEIVDTLMPIEVREVTELIGYGYRDKYEFDLLRKKEKIKREILELKTKEDPTRTDLAKVEVLKKELLAVK